MVKERWEIDSSHSSIHFSVRHMLIAKVRGQFTRWSGAISGSAPASVDITIDASSIDTGVADRDAHLKSKDFLDVATHPEIKFKGSGLVGARGRNFELLGELTIRGVTKVIAFEVEHAGTTKDPWGHERAGFSAKTWIDRKDFGLTWNQVLEAGGVLVGDRVDIELEVEAVRQVAAKVA